MIKIDKLRFGPAGVPLSTPKPSTISGVYQVKKLNLDAMEIEFVQGVRMSIDTAKQAKEVSIKENVILTAHGPYYINLLSTEEKKVEASVQRILDTARITYQAGGYSIVFHAAYYQRLSKSEAYEKVKNIMRRIISTLKNENVEIWVRPELTGKPVQFGDLDELIKLSQDIEMVMPCIDFAHLHARYNGKYNTETEIKEVLAKIETGLGRDALDNMHIHISGINYTDKGERNHLNLEESDYNYHALINAWKEYKIKGVVISESPNLETDALILKKLYYA
ncbi:MAG: TIM barrel protein [Thermoprotei archaeon]